MGNKPASAPILNCPNESPCFKNTEEGSNVKPLLVRLTITLVKNGTPSDEVMLMALE